MLVPRSRPVSPVSAAGGITAGRLLQIRFRRIVLRVIILLPCAEALARGRPFVLGLLREAFDLADGNSFNRWGKSDGTDVAVPNPAPDRDARNVDVLGEPGLREISRCALPALIYGGRIAHRTVLLLDGPPHHTPFRCCHLRMHTHAYACVQK